MLEHLEHSRFGRASGGLYLYEKFDAEPEFAGYSEFPERVAGYAEHFRDQGIRPGTRVLFPFETSMDTLLSFLALIEVGAVPLSVKPLLPNTPSTAYLNFVERLARQFRASHVLGAASIADADVPLAVLPLPQAGTRRARPRLRTPAGDEIAFVQFSSGSTSFPKGIPIRQDKLRANLEIIARTDGRDAHDRISSWLPLYHDMGLIGGLLSGVVTGNDVLLATPMTFLYDAPGWWEHMSREGVTTTVIPNFAVDYSLKLMRELGPEALAEMDLSRLRSIYLGSEPINISHLLDFVEVMSATGLSRRAFMPCYGMAEAVLMVSSQLPGQELRVRSAPSGMPAISVGRPMPGFAVQLRNDDGLLCRDHELGEIELAGGTLATTYFDDAKPLAGADGFFATGDLGFVDEGELFITGRIGDRIKVNGQSLFATDFEQTVERLDFMREGRTVVIQSEDRIVVLAEAARRALADIDGSRVRIVEHLAQMLGVTVRACDIHFVHAGQLTRTSSGKLQRRAIAQAYHQDRLTGYTLGSALAQG
jgi:acyl-CoA synthetase (AMP-forming)/AMP-acid ligase II